MKKVVIFASGSGSNAENIHNYFKGKNVKIEAIFTNNSNAFVIERAKKLNIPCVIFNKEEFTNGNTLNKVNSYKPDLIILAGFLWLIPLEFVNRYPNKIVNIHPALLPKFGGKGMYGEKVHKEVVQSGETESGITIHFVNEKYDEGNVIFQAKCKINSSDNYEDVAHKIHELEYEHFPKVIEQVLKNK